MKTRQKIIPTVCCIALLSACASNQSVSVVPSWSVTPMTTSSNVSNKPEAMYQMGRYYQGQNRYDQAIAAYQKALAADNGFAEARNGLGVIYSRQGKYREAIEAFQAAIQQAPKASHIYSNLGYAYYLQGQYGESVTALEQATVLDPTNQRAISNLGLAYAKAGNKDESVQAFAQAANMPAGAAVVAKVATKDAAMVPSQSASSLPVEVASVNTEVNMAPVSPLPVSQYVVQRPVVQRPVVQKFEVQKFEVQKAEVQKPEIHKSEVQMPEVQILALPKDSGVIRSASAAFTVPVVDSRVKLVQLSPNVYELHEQQHSAAPMQVAAVADVTSAAQVRVEVANGNGVTGMAGKVGQFLRGQGYPAARLTNQKPFQVRMTQIQYRDGYQAEALSLKLSVPGAPELVQRNDMRADISVRLVLGKDMVARQASFDGKREKIQLALNASVS